MVLLPKDDEITPLEFNNLVRVFNSVENGFNIALEVVSSVLAAQIAQSTKALAEKARWDALPRQGGLAIQEKGEVILGWKQRASEEGIYFLVALNARGGCSLISRESVEFPIPARENQLFRHASGFMATYTDQQTAIEEGKLLVNTILDGKAGREQS